MKASRATKILSTVRTGRVGERGLVLAPPCQRALSTCFPERRDSAMQVGKITNCKQSALFSAPQLPPRLLLPATLLVVLCTSFFPKRYDCTVFPIRRADVHAVARADAFVRKLAAAHGVKRAIRKRE